MRLKCPNVSFMEGCSIQAVFKCSSQNNASLFPVSAVSTSKRAKKGI